MFLALLWSAYACPLARTDRATTEISCIYEVEVDVSPFYPEGPRRPRPPHAPADFSDQITRSARLALPVARGEGK